MKPEHTLNMQVMLRRHKVGVLERYLKARLPEVREEGVDSEDAKTKSDTFSIRDGSGEQGTRTEVQVTFNRERVHWGKSEIVFATPTPF